MKEIKNILICGAGMMGKNIGYVFASNPSFQVGMYDLYPTDVEAGIRTNTKQLLDKGVITEQELSDRLSRISFTNDIDSDLVKNADLVIEAVFEDMKIKRETFAKLEARCRPDTIFCTNSSVMSPSEISAELQHRERFVGTHFWNPGHLIPLVEVVKSDASSDEVAQTVMEVLRSVGKKPVLCKKDVPGFIANRMQHALWREAISIVEEGRSSKTQLLLTRDTLDEFKKRTAAVKEAGIEVVGRPDPEVVSMSEDEGATLKVKVAVKPEVELGEYTGLTVNKDVKTVDEADVDAEIKRMQDRNGRLLTREGAAENGDTVDIDFEGFVDGKAFEGGKAEHYSLVLGSGSFIPGFEDQVVGHSAGEEFGVNVKFPEEYGAAELAGKDATFKIKLHEVKYKELPALDDDFAKDVSEYDTLDELKDSIRNNIKTNLDKQAEQKVENDLMDQVIANMKADIPDAMVDSRIDELVQDFEYRISQQGLKLADYLKYMGMNIEQFRAQFKEQADKQVKMRLAMEAIVAKEGITASDEEFEEEVKRIADAYKMEADKVKSIVDAAAVKADLAINKAIDFVKEKANVVTAEPKEEEKQD